MKHLILISGLILILINSMAGIIFQDYETHNLHFSDFSILLSTGIFFLLYKMNTADGFKIGFVLFFGLTGIIRFICAISMNNEIKNNYSLLIFISVFCLECLLTLVGNVMRNK